MPGTMRHPSLEMRREVDQYLGPSEKVVLLTDTNIDKAGSFGQRWLVVTSERVMVFSADGRRDGPDTQLRLTDIEKATAVHLVGQMAPRSFRIFNGMSMALPPEYVDRNFGSGQNSHTRADLDFQCRSCMFGHLTVCGVHPLGATPNPEHLRRIKHHLEVYKNAIRPWQRTSRIYHHTPVFEGHDPRGWGVLELVSEDRARAVVGLFRLRGPAEREVLLRLRGLDEGRTYRVRFDNSGHTATVSGWELMRQGMTVALDHALTSELLIVEEA